MVIVEGDVVLNSPQFSGHYPSGEPTEFASIIGEVTADSYD